MKIQYKNKEPSRRLPVIGDVFRFEGKHWIYTEFFTHKCEGLVIYSAAHCFCIETGRMAYFDTWHNCVVLDATLILE